MTLVFIPVRGGSTSIPLKNIKLLAGKPLVYWTARAASDTASVDAVVIATDHAGIKETVLGFDLPKVVVYDRLPDNAQTTSSTESVMLEYIERHDLPDDELFCLVQATSPLLTTADIEGALEHLKKENAASLITTARVKHFLWRQDGVPINYDYRHRPRRQEFDGTLMENGALYVNRVGNIKRDGNRLSEKIAVYEMAPHTMVDIDEPDDWPLAEQMMRKYHPLVIGERKNRTIRLFVSDVDGVMTDAGMYYGSDGVELKKFSTRDAVGLRMLRERGVKTAIITGENSPSVQNRANKIKIDYVFQGIEDKAVVLKKLCEETGIPLSETAYIGDDLNDLPAIELAGFTACPTDAADAVKEKVDLVLTRRGGDGAVREWCERILSSLK